MQKPQKMRFFPSSPKFSGSVSPRIRRVNDYIIFFDEVLGIGEFGTVYKAQLASDLTDPQNSEAERLKVRPTVDESKQIFACKIYDLQKFEESELEQVMTEVKINSQLKSDYCIRHHQTYKTKTKIYMILEYSNSFNLETLIE